MQPADWIVVGAIVIAFANCIVAAAYTVLFMTRKP